MDRESVRAAGADREPEEHVGVSPAQADKQHRLPAGQQDHDTARPEPDVPAEAITQPIVNVAETRPPEAPRQGAGQVTLARPTPASPTPASAPTLTPASPTPASPTPATRAPVRIGDSN